MRLGLSKGWKSPAGIGQDRAGLEMEKGINIKIDLKLLVSKILLSIIGSKINLIYSNLMHFRIVFC